MDRGGGGGGAGKIRGVGGGAPGRDQSIALLLPLHARAVQGKGEGTRASRRCCYHPDRATHPEVVAVQVHRVLHDDVGTA